MRDQTVCAILIVLTLLAVAAMFYFSGKDGRADMPKDGYLVAPYLDLDEPGERGSYYSLVDCP